MVLDKLLTLFDRVDEFITIRSLTEEVFIVAKNTLSLKRLYRSTIRSVKRWLLQMYFYWGPVSHWDLTQNMFSNASLNGNFGMGARAPRYEGWTFLCYSGTNVPPLLTLCSQK